MSSNKNKNNIKFEIHNFVTFCHTGKNTYMYLKRRYSVVFQSQTTCQFQANENDILQMFEKAMCWAPEGKIITFKEWNEDLGGTPEGKPW